MSACALLFACRHHVPMRRVLAAVVFVVLADLIVGAVAAAILGAKFWRAA